MLTPEQFHELRAQLGFTQENVKIAGISPRSYRDWENGKRTPQPLTLQKLRKYVEEQGIPWPATVRQGRQDVSRDYLHSLVDGLPDEALPVAVERLLAVGREWRESQGQG